MIERLVIELAKRRVVGQKALDFRRECELVLVRLIVEWFLTQVVPGNKEFLLILIPDNENKHTAQQLQNSLTPTPKELKNDFSVRISLELHPFTVKFFPQRLVVVDLSVENNAKPMGVIDDRLMSARKIDD